MQGISSNGIGLETRVNKSPRKLKAVHTAIFEIQCLSMKKKKKKIKSESEMRLQGNNTQMP